MIKQLIPAVTCYKIEKKEEMPQKQMHNNTKLR